MKKLLRKENKSLRLTFFVATIVLLILLVTTFTLPFNQGLFSHLYTKPTSRAATEANPAAFIPPTVFAFYYDWYGAPPFTSSYIHWDGGGGFLAPNDIESDFYPSLGAYSSRDPAVLDQQMKWMKQAGIDVAVLSWWGQGDYTDQNAPAVLNTAAQNNLKVSFMIEPYANRTIQSIVSDIQYIYSKYGTSPAFYRVSRPTEFGPSTAPRGVFFIYGLDGGESTVQAVDSLRGTSNDAIILARMDDSLIFTDANIRTQLSYSHVDGFFNYSQFAPPTSAWPKSSDYMIVVSTLPGWDHSRLPGQTGIQDRQNGQFYDNDWQTLINQKVEGVSVLSFNEWHEGGQIEPAVPYTYTTATGSAITYQNYNGAYGLTGTAASMAYITRTAYWANQYKSLMATATATPSSLPTVVPEDLDGDSHVNLTDLSILAINYGLSGAAILNPTADINHDGVVNLTDLSLLASHYGS